MIWTSWPSTAAWPPYYLYDLYYARPAKDYADAFLADAKAGKFQPPRRSEGNISTQPTLMAQRPRTVSPRESAAVAWRSSCVQNSSGSPPASEANTSAVAT